MVPVHTVAILGTTEQRRRRPGRLRDQARARWRRCSPRARSSSPTSGDAAPARLCRRAAALPAAAEATAAAAKDGRADLAGPRRDRPRGRGRRRQLRLDRRRQADDLPADGRGQTADVVCASWASSAPCTTADEVLPGQGDGQTTGWATGSRSTRPPAAAMRTSSASASSSRGRSLDEFLDRRRPRTPDDVRRGTRLGMGPCQGGFCTFRAAGRPRRTGGASRRRLRSRDTSDSAIARGSSGSGSRGRGPSRPAASSRSYG